MSDSGGGGSTAGKVTLGCGALMLLASASVCLFSAFHVFLDPHGKISDDEALPGMLAGILCSLVSVAIAVVGAFLAFRKTSSAPAPAGSSPGAGAPPKKPFPTHLISGCASLLFVSLSCAAFGFASYAYDRSGYYERRADEERARQSSPYGGYGFGLGPYYYEDKADEAQNMAGGAACCGGLTFLLFFAGVGGAVVLRRRNLAKMAERSGPPPGGPPSGGSSPGGAPPSGGFGQPPQGPPPPGNAFGSG